MSVATGLVGFHAPPLLPMDRLGLPRALMVTVGAWVAVNTLVVLRSTPAAVPGHVRATHVLWDAGSHVALGLVAAGVALVLARVRARARRIALGGLGAGLLPAAWFVMRDDALGLATEVGGPAAEVVYGAMVGVVCVGLAAAAVAGRFLDRPRWRWAAWASALLGLVANHFVLQDDYPSAHLAVAMAAVTLGSVALRGAGFTPRARSVAARTPWAAAAALALTTLWVAPPNAVQLRQLQFEGAVVAPILARLRQGADADAVVVPRAWKPWFEPRTGAPPVAARPAIADAPIVILYTIDSLRADVVLSGAHDEELPALARLRDESVSFVHARAPGSQTVYTLAQLFMGTYYSMQYWTKHGDLRDLWPDDDESVRFPELLTAAGVSTVSFPTTKWLNGATGIARGFAEEDFVPPRGTRYTLSATLLPRLLTRLKKHRDGPLFLFVHVLDAHYTVSPREPKAPPFERYIANLRTADQSLAKIREVLKETGLEQRTVLIVSADHGDAFGEHGTMHHRTTLYDEVLRVPLLIHGPGLAARQVETPVSVIDLGPTILDLFGLETPGHFMGESLLGLARGEDRVPTRPIVAEGRLKKAMLFPDGTKVIVDDRNGTTEIYQLGEDPGELENRSDVAGKGGAERVQLLRQFFEAQRIRRPGYQVPYRP